MAVTMPCGKTSAKENGAISVRFRQLENCC